MKRENINDGLKTFRETAGAVLLDVRTVQEYKEGHIPGSTNLPGENIKAAREVLPDKETPIFSYCLRGSRSKRAAAALCAMGYRNVTNIGGIVDYRGEIERG